MCGIAGYIIKAPAHRPELMRTMLDSIARRGPDGEGSAEFLSGDWKVGLGHRRLSIIDLSTGQQPLGNEDDTLQITFNGEIFNFQELREALLRKGHVFKTRSDTESIVHLYEEKGEKAFRELNGMFALALWDQRSGSLVLARDPAGIKPLYYAVGPEGELAFASQLDTLLRVPFVSRKLDPEALANYFFVDYAHPPVSLLKDVRKLPPGCFLVWRDGKLEGPVRYFRLDDTERPISEAQAIEELRERLETAVRRQLVSDVPVGVFLSGGIDSSLVAALAQKNSSGSLHTFSIGFEDPAFDESPYALRVAEHIGSQHHVERVSEGDLLEVLPQALDSLDEPVSDPSVLPTYIVSRLAARHVKVALGGDAGDELFAGYPTYLAHRAGRAFAHVPRPMRAAIAGAVGALPVRYRYQSLEWKLKRFFGRFDGDPYLRHFRWMSNTDLPDLERLFGSTFRTAILERARESITPGESGSFNRFLALDFVTYMPGSVLAKVDRTSMSQGLEVRPPFLDQELVEWAFSLPFELKLRGKDAKYLLKRVGEPLLPREILYRKKKGFAIPLSAWLRSSLRSRLEGVLKDSPVFEASPLRHEILREWAVSHFAGREDRSRPLWSLIVLDHWMRRKL